MEFHQRNIVCILDSTLVSGMRKNIYYKRILEKQRLHNIQKPTFMNIDYYKFAMPDINN